jgi:hypothetical protein
VHVDAPAAIAAPLIKPLTALLNSLPVRFDWDHSSADEAYVLPHASTKAELKRCRVGTSMPAFCTAAPSFRSSSRRRRSARTRLTSSAVENGFVR